MGYCSFIWRGRVIGETGSRNSKLHKWFCVGNHKTILVHLLAEAPILMPPDAKN